MALTTPNLGLIVWNLPADPYDSTQLAGNLAKLDEHDHTPGKGVPITTAAIADGAITSTKLDTSVFGAVLPTGAVTNAVLAPNSVTTDKILDGTILTADLADNSITTAKILDGTIGIGDLSTATANSFLKLLTGADMKVNWGLSGAFGGFNAVGDISTVSVTHGLGHTPSFAVAIQANGGHYGSGVRVHCEINDFSATSLVIGGTCTRQPIAPTVTANAWWLVIG